MVDALVFGVPTSPAKALGAAIAIGGMCAYTYMNIKVEDRLGIESSASPLFSPCKSPQGLQDLTRDLQEPLMPMDEKKEL